MKKTIFLILIIFGILFSISSVYALDCSVSTTCNTNDIILRMNSDTNAHTAVYSYADYPYSICCSGTSGIRTCGNNEVLRISAENNAHIEKNTLTTAGYSDACFGDLVCGYSSDCSSDLGSNFKCLASMSADTNAHIAKCDSYSNKVCCTTLDLDLSCDACANAGKKWDLTGGSCTGAIDFSWETGTDPYCCGNDANEFYTTENCPGITGKTACCNLASDKIDADGNCVSSCEQPCTLNEAYWSIDDALEGEIMNLIVKGDGNCIGKTARFTIEEDDPIFTIGDNSINNQPLNANFINSGVNAIATGIWIAEWHDDGFIGNPEYKFTAYTDGTQILSSEPKLSVTKSTPGCGNGVIDNGENCVTCAEDAGCASGNLCCSSDTAIGCKSSCDVTPDCNLDGICQNTESCNCQDCDNGQDGCAVDNACDFGTGTCVSVSSAQCIQSNCNGESNMVCDHPECSTSPDLLTCSKDPDCTCEEYGNFVGTTYLDCGEDRCNPADWNAATNCCLGNCAPAECFAGWQCPEWSKCKDGFRTRGACTLTTPLPSGCEDVNTELTASQKKACVESVKFPVYDNLNLLFSILILIGYYLIKTRR